LEGFEGERRFSRLHDPTPAMLKSYNFILNGNTSNIKRIDPNAVFVVGWCKVWAV
jgi:hypothetical protein